MMIPKLMQMVTETFSTPLQHSPLIYLLLVPISLILLRKWLSKPNSSSLSIPPSPPKLPIIGNLHQVSALTHRDFQAMSKTYGPVMLLHFGSRPILVISSAEAASQVFKTHDVIFSDRPKLIFFEKIIYNYKDIAGAPYGEYWRQLRSVSVLNLMSNKMIRSYGAVRQSETTLMLNKIQEAASTSSVVSLSEMLIKLSHDVTCLVAMGRRYSDIGTVGGKLFTKISSDLTTLFTRGNIGDYIPWLSWVTWLSGLDAELDDLAKRMDYFLEMVIEEHVAKEKRGDGENKNEDEVSDFVDVMLSIQKENLAGMQIDRIGIKGTLLDMFIAGTDTTYTTLDWVMSELMKNPRAMKKVQEEVRSIVGNKEIIPEEDLVGMHYMKAVFKETFRLHPPLPLLVPRSTRQDVTINGYNIKANTQVMVNVYAIGRDPKSFTNPELFEPERFLSNGMDYRGNDFELLPFGAGRRGCPGMNFGMALAETVLANLLQKFDWELPDGVKPDDLDMTECSGISAPRVDYLKVVPRRYIA